MPKSHHGGRRNSVNGIRDSLFVCEEDAHQRKMGNQRVCTLADYNSLYAYVEKLETGRHRLGSAADVVVREEVLQHLLSLNEKVTPQVFEDHQPLVVTHPKSSSD